MKNCNKCVNYQEKEKPIKVGKLQWGNTAEKQMTWQEASDYCNSLGKGWRLPTRAELVEAYDTKVEGFEKDYYWSSTTFVNDTDYAWSVYFYGGSVNASNKTNANDVRPVRGGQ